LNEKKPAKKETEENKVEVGKVENSSTPDLDLFWIKFGKKTLKDATVALDERAKFMLTTCASLIVVNFGLLLAFKVQSLSFKVAPQFFLAVSAALFATSFFPVTRPINLQSPDSIESAYNIWIKWKSRWNRYGFILFIIGLMTMAITSLIGNTAGLLK
jgi:hypothetical protein